MFRRSLVALLIAASLAGACSSTTGSSISPSPAVVSSIDAKGGKTGDQRVLFYVYSLNNFIVGQPVLVTSSAGTQTVYSTAPHGDTTAYIPAQDTQFTVSITRAGFCPVTKTLAADVNKGDKWVALTPCP
jgi:hypothetical protein